MKESSDIVVTNLSKVFQTGIFKRRMALQDLSLTVRGGEIVGLLGANGSGKSTTLKMILGFLRPTSGTIEICGHAAGTRNAKASIGYLPENPRFQKFMTGRQIMRYLGNLYNLSGKTLESRIDSTLDMVSLRHAQDEKVGGYSKGMTQRLAIAQALLNRPRVLIFDEPMSGLDPLGRIEVRNLVRTIHSEFPGTTLFFSSHILSDVESLCSSVALLKQGKLQLHCSVEELLVTEKDQFSIVATHVPESLKQKLQKEFSATRLALGIGIDVEGMESLLARIAEIRSQGGKILSIATRRIGLEEALFSDRVPSSPRLRPALGGQP